MSLCLALIATRRIKNQFSVFIVFIRFMKRKQQSNSAQPIIKRRAPVETDYQCSVEKRRGGEMDDTSQPPEVVMSDEDDRYVQQRIDLPFCK